MRIEFLYNVIVVIFVNSGVVFYVLCEFCWVLFLGCCSYVVVVLFFVFDYVKKYGFVLVKLCISEECFWNKGKKRNKNFGRISEVKYSSKKKLVILFVIDFDLRLVKYWKVMVIYVNGFLSVL